ncbi:MAG: hypothetical protein AAFX06_01910 [Planctomycetota bacterium]
MRAGLCRFAIALFISVAGSVHSTANELVVNGEFTDWTDDSPTGWAIEIGAQNGADEPLSEVTRLPDKGLLLRGNQTTLAWRIVKQKLDAGPGDRLKLRFKARTKDIRREARQFNNCYVGLLSFDAKQKVIGSMIQSLPDSTDGWKDYSIEYEVPNAAASTAVCAFLSKTGLFGVQSLSVVKAKAAPKPDNKEDQENLLTNGALDQWNHDKPKSWKVEVAAKNGSDRPASQVKPLPEGGVSLTGNARTLAWNSVSQSLVLKPGTTYTLQFEAAGDGIRRQGRQYDNCYVGVFSFDGNDQRVDMAIEDLSKVTAWKPFQLNFSPPPTAKRSEIILFLSKTGTLRVKSVSVREATPDRPFR